MSNKPKIGLFESITHVTIGKMFGPLVVAYLRQPPEERKKRAYGPANLILSTPLWEFENDEFLAEAVLYLAKLTADHEADEEVCLAALSRIPADMILHPELWKDLEKIFLGLIPREVKKPHPETWSELARFMSQLIVAQTFFMALKESTPIWEAIDSALANTKARHSVLAVLVAAAPVPPKEWMERTKSRMESFSNHKDSQVVALALDYSAILEAASEPVS